ncbi:PKD domain-containing protein [Patescibacteria group bacterium]|nr:PKD domain-containing protein [Patescibacteria group bacterium]MBU1673680.1 PKD domain-containing protein [Patescibacteria group bacterium]MBU1963490.1 PKD domain-containing protein [Patescibacteria group bacterium]
MKFPKFSLLIILLGLMLVAVPVFAQPATNEEAVTEDETALVEIQPEVFAKAGGDKNVAVGRNVLFDGSGSTGPEGVGLSYFWDFGDGITSEGIDATHIYEAPGTYRVNLKVTGGGLESEGSIIVSVEEDLIVLITDPSIDDEIIAELVRYAQTQEVLLVPVSTKRQEADYLAATKLAQKLIENEDDLLQSDLIISWTAGNVGLNALTELANLYKETDVDIKFGQKGIVGVTEQNLSAAGRIAQGTYNSLQPEYMLLTHPDYITTIIDAKKSENVVTELNQKKASYQRIGVHSERGLASLNPFNFMSYAINYMVNKGIALDTIYLILVLPVIATIVAFFRQIIGIRAFGIYVPSILALTFLITGLKYGLFIFAALVLVGTLSRLLAKKLKLLYLPRMAIVLTLVSLSIFAIFYIGALTNRTGFISLSIFPILILIIITEKFVELQIEKGPKKSIFLTLETLIISVLTYFLVSWDTFKTLLLAFPELILLTILINYIIGRFTGLRLLEYFRFKKVLKNAGDTKK